MTNESALKRIARSLEEEPEHAFQVCRIALQLYDGLKDLHGLGVEERRILQAGALLHDVGHSINSKAHHKHSRDIILRTSLPGFTPEAHTVVACVARYHRKAHPHPKHKLYGALGAEAQEITRKLAAIVRIADGLDRTHDCDTRRVTTAFDDASVTMNVIQARANSTDIWGAERKAALFEEVYKRTLILNSETTP